MPVKNIKAPRKKAPEVFEVNEINIPQPEISHLPNGIPLYVTRMGTQPIVKVEFIFFSGRAEEQKRLESRATLRMLREGTKKHSAADWAEEVEFLAGTASMPVLFDTNRIVVYALTKNMSPLLNLVADIIFEPLFPEKELNVWTQNNIQKLAIELTKNDVIAYRKITEVLFGEDTSYGYSSVAENFNALTTDDLKNYYRRNFTSDNMSILVAGDVTDGTLKQIETLFGSFFSKKIILPAVRLLRIDTMAPQKLHFKNSDSTQTSIRIGRRFAPRHDPDYFGFNILNVILGGYFGARLMLNIREKKGYTYNIYSALETYSHDGYFYIASDVGNAFVKKAIKEIYIELQKLIDTPVSDAELQMVRSYLLGNMLQLIDGPMNVSEVISGYVSEKLPFDTLELFVSYLKNITPHDIQRLAAKYLNPKDLTEITVGI